MAQHRPANPSNPPSTGPLGCLQVGNYLEKYTKAFLPSECLRLGYEVSSISKVPGAGSTTSSREPASQEGLGTSQQEGLGTSQQKKADLLRWEVRWRATGSATAGGKEVGGNNEGAAVFDHVVVATGFFGVPHVPELPGLAGFGGSVSHSSCYRDGAQLAGRRVAVIGGGHSGVEVTADLAAHGACVTHIISRPLSILARYLPVDTASAAPLFLPLDLQLYRRSKRRSASEQVLRGPQENRKLMEALRPLCGVVPSPLPSPWTMETLLESPPQLCISDSYLGLCRTGRITPLLGRATGATHSSLLVSPAGAGTTGEGAEVTDLDAVVLCTGFKPALGFMPPALLDAMAFDATDNFSPVLLHRNMFHPSAPGTAVHLGHRPHAACC